MKKKTAPKKTTVKKSVSKKVVAKKVTAKKSSQSQVDHLLSKHPNLRLLLPTFVIIAVLYFYLVLR